MAMITTRARGKKREVMLGHVYHRRLAILQGHSIVRCEQSVPEGPLVVLQLLGPGYPPAKRGPAVVDELGRADGHPELQGRDDGRGAEVRLKRVLEKAAAWFYFGRNRPIHFFLSYK